jgi:hypothetical protein
MNRIEHTTHDPSITLYALIAARLQALNAAHWNAVIFTWLARYDGMGRFCFEADEQHTPTQEVLNCLNQYDFEPADALLARDLSELGFLAYRFRRDDLSERWNPLECSLQTYLAQEEHPTCWRWDAAYPPSEQIAEWLLVQLQEQ